MAIYILAEEKLFNLEIGSYTAFGITALDNNSKKVICSVSDVFVDRKRAEMFIRLFNEAKLDVIHLQNAIENIIQSA